MIACERRTDNQRDVAGHQILPCLERNAVGYNVNKAIDPFAHIARNTALERARTFAIQQALNLHSLARPSADPVPAYE